MKLFLSFTITFLLLVACTSKKDRIVAIATEKLGKPSSIEGDIYRFTNLNDNNIFRDFKTIKEKIDKELNATPTEINNLKVNSASGHIYTMYKWDLPSIYTYIWCEYKENDEIIELVVREK